jgi:hypothetical protein
VPRCCAIRRRAEVPKDRRLLSILFNGGAFATRDGVAIADVPRSVGRIGVRYGDRDYVSRALGEGVATIGHAVLGRALRVPVVGMAVPIRDERGVVIGALAGITNLNEQSFLDHAISRPYGKGGGHLLVAKRYRQVVTATDKERALEVLPTAGLSPALDRFIGGFEGSAVFVNPMGIEVLASTAAIPVAGWYAATILPTAEAFAPIDQLEQQMLGAALALTLILGGSAGGFCDGSSRSSPPHGRWAASPRPGIPSNCCRSRGRTRSARSSPPSIACCRR